MHHEISKAYKSAIFCDPRWGCRKCMCAGYCWAISLVVKKKSSLWITVDCVVALKKCLLVIKNKCLTQYSLWVFIKFPSMFSLAACCSCQAEWAWYKFHYYSDIYYRGHPSSSHQTTTGLPPCHPYGVVWHHSLNRRDALLSAARDPQYGTPGPHRTEVSTYGGFTTTYMEWACGSGFQPQCLQQSTFRHKP